MKLSADLPALTGLRALAALWVASTHVQAFVGQQVWFIERLGSAVNLGNVPPHEAISLETLRVGLRADTLKLFHGGE